MTSRMIGVLRVADIIRAVWEVARLPGTGVHVYRSVDGGDAVVVESIQAFAQDLLDRINVWRPTHRHYNGSQYRELAKCFVEREWGRDQTLYENADGLLIVRPTDEFEGTVQVEVAAPSVTTKRRFVPLNVGSEPHTVTASESHNHDGGPERAAKLAAEAQPAPLTPEVARAALASYVDKRRRELVSVVLTRDEAASLVANTATASGQEKLRAALQVQP